MQPARLITPPPVRAALCLLLLMLGGCAMAFPGGIGSAGGTGATGPAGAYASGSRPGAAVARANRSPALSLEPAGSEPAGSEPAGSEPAGSEPAGSEPWATEPLAAARTQAERDHLWRVGIWGAANLVAGTAVLVAAQPNDDSLAQGLAIQAAAWGTVNAGIAVIGLMAASPKRAEPWAQAVRRERRYHDILLLNTGLNVAYASFGAAMLIAAESGVDKRDAFRGHGLALIIQGAGLFVLDGVSLLASRRRLGDLLHLPIAITPLVGDAGGGIALTMPF